MEHCYHTLTSGLRIHYTAWGRVDQHPVVCVHGLSRNARDFDALAKVLAKNYYVICVDVPGRGQSAWLEKLSDYHLLNYAKQMIEMLVALGLIGARTPHWIGTSMGGLIAMTMQALAPGSFKKLVLNDVGPVIEVVALQRIAQYIGAATHFANRALAEQYAKKIWASFGAQTQAQWAALTDHYYLDNPDGSVRIHYDPAIAVATKQAVSGLSPESVSASEAMLWASLKSLNQACLVIRGAQSDLLSIETVEKMRACNALVSSITIPNCGHAPHLLDEHQIGCVKGFLNEQ